MLPILCLCDFPDKNSGVGCCFLLQGIFPTQGSNPCLPASPALAGRLFTTKPPGKLGSLNGVEKPLAALLRWRSSKEFGLRWGTQSFFVMLGKTLSLSVPQFPHLNKGWGESVLPPRGSVRLWQLVRDGLPMGLGWRPQCFLVPASSSAGGISRRN